MERSSRSGLLSQLILYFHKNYFYLHFHFHFRNEYKVGNKVILRVDHTGSATGQNKSPPVLQYVTRRQEVAYRDKTAQIYCIYGGTLVYLLQLIF